MPPAPRTGQNTAAWKKRQTAGCPALSEKRSGRDRPPPVLPCRLLRRCRQGSSAGRTQRSTPPVAWSPLSVRRSMLHRLPVPWRLFRWQTILHKCCRHCAWRSSPALRWTAFRDSPKQHSDLRRLRPWQLPHFPLKILCAFYQSNLSLLSELVSETSACSSSIIVEFVGKVKATLQKKAPLKLCRMAGLRRAVSLHEPYRYSREENRDCTLCAGCSFRKEISEWGDAVSACKEV